MSTITANLSGHESNRSLKNVWIDQQENIIEPKKLYNKPPLLWLMWYGKQISSEALLDVNSISSEFSDPRQNTDVTSQIEMVMNMLKSPPLQVVIPQPDVLRGYLLRYYDLTDLLLPVCEATRQQFGFQAQLSLEVYHDPEVEDEYIALYVRQSNYDESVMRRIKEIRMEYEENLSSKTGWFLLTTDFRPPTGIVEYGLRLERIP